MDFRRKVVLSLCKEDGDILCSLMFKGFISFTVRRSFDGVV